MLKFGNKEFRNLQEQVKKNMDDILFILQEEGVLNEFGIKVVGQESTITDMPTVADYKEDNPDWSYGDAYAIGTEEPYELYILTRANGTHPNDYWFNIGEFPAPGPQGPQGEQGDVGPQGPTGNPGANGVSPQLGVGNVVVETLESDQDATVAITESGTQANPIWNFNFGIPKGQDGSAVTSVAWGDITGSLTNQTDLVSALQAKANASALASYATQVYANNVASNATYQANVYTDSKISALSSAIAGLSSVYAGLNSNNAFAGINSFSKSIGLLSSANIVVTDANQSEYTINIPRVSGTMALTNDIPSLSGYATQSWVSSNFLSIGTPIGGAAVWGSISGTLANQTDLMNKFSEYAPLSSLSNYAELSVLSSYATVSALSSAISAVEAEIPDIRGLASETYVDDSISALSSVYAPIGDYATNSALSSAISGVNSTISSLNYLSVGALSSETYIPRVGGDNDGTYWTAITLGDDTYSIPQGGVSSVAWGSISGTLSNQTDLQTALDNKVDKEVTVGDDSSSIDINETVIGLYSGGSDTNSSLEISKDGVVIQANDDVEGTSTQLTVSDGSVTITRDSDSASIELFDLASMSYVDASISALSSIYADINSLSSYATVSSLSSYATVSSLSEYAKVSALSEYATISAMSSAIDGVNSTISSLNYASVHALSEGTVIPSVSGTNDGTNWTSLTIDNDTYDIPVGGTDIETVYLSTSASRGTLTQEQLDRLLAFPKSTVINYPDSSINNLVMRLANDVASSYRWNYVNINDQSAYAYWFNLNSQTGAYTISEYTQSSPSIPSARSGITLVDNYYGLSTTIPGAKTFTGTVNFTNSVSFTGFASFNSNARFNGSVNFVNNEIYGGGANFTEARLYSLPSQSGTLALVTDIPSVSEYATVSALSSAVSDINSTISGLSSVYAPINYVPSTVSGYASEVWTFTLSDNTTVSKTVLVG